MAPVHRVPSTVPKRLFNASARYHALNPLFHLQGLSTSRETQWLSKASGLSRVEHSPGLQLLRSEAELQQAAKVGNSSTSTRNAVDHRNAPSARRRTPTATDITAIARPWIKRLRKELDEFDRTVTNHLIINSRHGGVQPNSDEAEASSIEQSYGARLQQQEAEISMLRSQLLEAQAKYQSDHETWTAVKMTMNSHKERAEAAGALCIVVATVLAAILYYDKFHNIEKVASPGMAINPTSASTCPNVQSEGSVLHSTSLADMNTAERDLPVSPQPSLGSASCHALQPPPPHQRRRSWVGLFWDD